MTANVDRRPQLFWKNKMNTVSFMQGQATEQVSSRLLELEAGGLISQPKYGSLPLYPPYVFLLKLGHRSICTLDRKQSDGSEIST